MTHTNENRWPRGHHVFRRGLGFPWKWTLGSFSSALDIHQQRKPAYDSAHVLTARKSPEVGHHPKFHPLRSAVLASEPPESEPTWVPSKLTEGAKVTHPPNGCLHQQSPSTSLMHPAWEPVSANTQRQGASFLPSHIREGKPIGTHFDGIRCSELQYLFVWTCEGSQICEQLPCLRKARGEEKWELSYAASQRGIVLVRHIIRN